MNTKNTFLHQKLMFPKQGYVFWITIFLLCACENFVEVDPPGTELEKSLVFTDDETAASVITGIYSRMMSGGLSFASGYYSSTTVTAGLYADELVSYRPSDPFYYNSLTPNEPAIGVLFWDQAYQYIYTSNLILEELAEATNISDEVRRQLQGEADFIRAFCYFYLVNFFGDVPLHLTPGYRENMKRPRTPKDKIYKQVITDLKEAQRLLPEDYSISQGERTRPNAWAATALLARVYLYLQNWEKAEEESTRVIGNTSEYELVPDLNTVFLKNSPEAIWQLKPVESRINTWEGLRFILVSTPPTTQGISDGLVQAFETGDERRNKWVNSVTDSTRTWYYPYKYKVRLGSELTEYSMVLRLAEQYLVRAEARVQQGNTAGAQEDLNMVRKRAGLENTTASTAGELQEAILHERRVELFAEWGHRWLDLKRTGQADTVLKGTKPHWEPTAILYPIPLNEIQRNPEITQNAGY